MTNKELLHTIAKDASERAAKNSGTVPQLLYAPILWALQEHLASAPHPAPDATDWKARCEAAEQERDDAKSTLSVWFSLAKKMESEGTQILHGSFETWVKRAQNGGMPKKDADLVRSVVSDAARLYLWHALVPVLRNIQDEALTAAQAENEKLRAALIAAREAILSLRDTRWSEAEGTDDAWVGYIDYALLKQDGDTQ